MVTKMPGAVWRPIGRSQGGRRTKTNAVVFHVDAGNASSLFGWFTDPRCRDSSHLFVKKDGTIEQYIDLDLIAYTSVDGNWRSIGVETQGFGTGEWTPAQVAAIVRIILFVHEHYGIPLQLMPDSKPSTAGVGYHRLGIDPWRVAGGERWSSSRGKVCPGDARVRQMPGIVAAAHGTKPTPPPEPAPGRVLSLGAVGEDVRRMQDGLNRVFPSYSHLAEDGSYGPATVAVVREFQRRATADGRYHSSIDGIAGAGTRAALAAYGIHY